MCIIILFLVTISTVYSVDCRYCDSTRALMQNTSFPKWILNVCTPRFILIMGEGKKSQSTRELHELHSNAHAPT